MPNRPYILAETTWADVRETRWQVAVLPWGATEAHNYHLPYGTDTIQCDHIASEAARKAWDRGCRVVVLPTVPFGVQTGQIDIPLCINMNPSTQYAVLRDVVESLAVQGVDRLVILNGHGGNDFRQMVRELSLDVPAVFLTVVNWYRVLDGSKYFDEPGDHAGEMETSLMLEAAPELVRPLASAGPGTERKPVLRAMRQGWAWTPRPWTKVTDDTGVGDPSAATAEKGRRFVQALTDELAAFLDELGEADLEKLYAE